MRLFPRLVRAQIAAAVALAFFSAVGAAGAEVPAGQPVDGITCDTQEGAQFHIHAHVVLLDHGKPVAIPGDIGTPAAGRCLYWIHTHTADGLVHIESPTFRSFELGNFFDIWGQPLSPTAAGPARIRRGQLRVFVAGVPYKGDPRRIVFAQHTEITLEAGPPFAKPVPFKDWNGQ